MELPPPPTLHEAQEALAPRGPWSFLRASLAQALKEGGYGLMGGWALAGLVPAFLLARHVAGFAGSSALPGHWGERLDLREFIDLATNSDLHVQPFPAWGLVFLVTGLAWALWSGWRLQAGIMDRRPSAGAWLLGGLEALLLGPLPLLVPTLLALWFLRLIGDRGIESFAWVRAILAPLLWATWSSACFLQWALCRSARLLESRPTWLRHMGHGFLRMWMHPVQWTLLLFGASALRVLLHGSALYLGWRLGGASTGRVWSLVLAQLLATLAGAWVQAVLLGTATRFLQHDVAVREAKGHPAPSLQEAPLEA